MKRLITMTVVAMLAIVGIAQDIQLSWGKETKIIAETEKYDENSMSFLYTEQVLEANRATTAYVQLFREQKFWEAPIYLHAEFRTFLAEQFTTRNIYMLGFAWGALATESGYMTLEALYRYDDRSNWQFTFVSGYSKGWFTFSNYADFYGIDRLYMFSENKIFGRITNNLQLGLNLELGLNTREGQVFSCYPFAVLRVDL